ncbi:hypothetical protein [Streptomyces sp. NPDC091268]|uniref:hypothetical protein n=1 Tax=Streptomyces sp. NPDC091268 TaxID=3365979 RepID=UPI00380E35CC
MFENPAPMRAARAALFAAVCVALSAVGHAHMSGADVAPSGLAVAFVLTGAPAWLGAGRRRGPASITAALLGVQAVLHGVFSVSGAAGAPPATAPPAGAPRGHHHGAGTAMPGMDMPGMDMPGMDGMAAHAHPHGGLGMIAAHLLAGLFCAAWLAWGEAAVFRLAGVLAAGALLAARPLSRALALLRARVAPVPRTPAPRPAYEPPRTLRGAVHAHTQERRGPPARRTTRATAPGRPARA